MAVRRIAGSKKKPASKDVCKGDVRPLTADLARVLGETPGVT